MTIHHIYYAEKSVLNIVIKYFLTLDEKTVIQHPDVANILFASLLLRQPAKAIAGNIPFIQVCIPFTGSTTCHVINFVNDATYTQYCP